MTYVKKTRLGLAVAAIAVLGAGCAGNSMSQPMSSMEDGAALWSMTCSHCHNLRPVDEHTPEEWSVIVAHMRTRAGLTSSEAAAITAFLQAAAASD